MKIKIAPANDRGFALGKFKDRYGAGCSIQKSSLATEDCIWLGIDEADPQVLDPNGGWKTPPFPEDTIFKTRMHLTRQQVKDLLPLLNRFVKTGELYPPRRK
jgi:hypothetical protein